MMKAFESLPEGYKEIYSVDLQKNKRLAILINSLALLFGIALAVPMHFFVPITTLFSMDKGFFTYVLKFAVLLVLTFVYIILHECVHGIAMKICGTKKVKYGFTGIYAFAGSDDYYGKKPYIFIALAPVVLWGVVLLAVNILVSYEWFWVIYLIQITNLTGAVGDLYVTAKFSRMPKDILVTDCGVSMKVFSRRNK